MISQKERWRRWQLALGVEDDQNELSDRDQRLNAALSALYDGGTEKRRGGLGASSPRVAKWLGDISRVLSDPRRANRPERCIRAAELKGSDA